MPICVGKEAWEAGLFNMKNSPKENITTDAVTAYFLKEYGHDLQMHFPFSNSQTLPNEQSNSDYIELSMVKKKAIIFERNGSYSESCTLYSSLHFVTTPL